MSLFGSDNKKEEKKACCCSCNCSSDAVEAAEEMKKAGGIKVLGGGCAKCHQLKANTESALAELGVREEVELITDFSVIATYGVMSTPALVVDNKVVSYGKVLKAEEAAAKIREVRNL